MAETKEKIVEKKVIKEKPLSDVEINKKIDASSKTKKEPLKVKTPYPEEHKKSDVDFIGEKLVKLSDRLNEIELSVNDMSIQLKQVRSRMGLV